jgi:hypothetical protein
VSVPAGGTVAGALASIGGDVRTLRPPRVLCDPRRGLDPRGDPPAEELGRPTPSPKRGADAPGEPDVGLADGFVPVAA